MSGERILHFTIGPVQGFVAQARRTRDLWAGSFLLAWMAGQAIAVVRKQGGTIVFPPVESDPMLGAIEGRMTGTPEIGSLPNRFKASAPAAFDPAQCADAARGAWAGLADAVWTSFVKTSAARLGNGTEGIWNRQIAAFWDIAWVIDTPAADRSDGAWLDQRKNWRSHLPPDEAGDHCTMMGDWQEISGHVRMHARDRQDEFWANLQQHSGVGPLELREGERLCAIAMVKRLFPRLDRTTMEQTIGWVPGGESKRVANWPSTGHVAACRWIARMHASDPTGCDAYAKHVFSELEARHFGESVNRIACLGTYGAHDFAALDANLLYADDIRNPVGFPLPGHVDREKLVKRLATFGQSGPTPYFALLLMDGDRVGELLGEEGGEKTVGEALATFTSQVDAIIRAHNGVTIYAGGDDVLAMLPVADSIAAVLRLRDAYRVSFPPGENATISAGLVFADHHEPLRAVVAEAHRLLKNVAKRDNQRDSIAISVLQPSGRMVEFVSKWQDNKGHWPVKSIDALGRTMRSDPQFSSRFVYNIDHRWLAPLRGDAPEPGLPAGGPARLGLAAAELERILTAELDRSRTHSPADAAAAGDVVQTVLGTLGERPGDPPRDRRVALRIEGLRLARFLAGCQAAS